jgi:hypothetical protein
LAVPSPTSAWQWLVSRRSQVRFAIRVAVAGALSFALATALGLAQGYWAVFTAVIVTQASVGGSLKATVDRLTGTLGGATAGAVVALLVAHQNAEVRMLGLALALLPVAFVAAIDARFRVAPVTTVIVLISPTGELVNPLLFTFDRVGEIALGSAVALAVSLLVLPARAHNVLAESTERLLDLYADYLALLLRGLSGPVDAAAQRRLQVGTRRRLNGMEAMVDEARRERSVRLSGEPDPAPILRSSQRLRADLIMVARAAIEPLPEPMATRVAPLLATIAETGRPLCAQWGRPSRRTRPRPPLKRRDLKPPSVPGAPRSRPCAPSAPSRVCRARILAGSSRWDLPSTSSAKTWQTSPPEPPNLPIPRATDPRTRPLWQRRGALPISSLAGSRGGGLHPISPRLY